jgi:hypothetical protein
MSFKDWMVVALAILVVWAVFAWLTASKDFRGARVDGERKSRSVQLKKVLKSGTRQTLMSISYIFLPSPLCPRHRCSA